MVTTRLTGVRSEPPPLFLSNSCGWRPGRLSARCGSICLKLRPRVNAYIMEHYSIESEIENINDPRTRVYFQEVFSSYTNGNYRSAVVMLWSVIICDLIYKLQHLGDVDNDPTALAILQHVETKQKNNPKSPEWEFELIKQIKNKTELLDIAEYQNLTYIQDIRHLSAHPVLSSSNLLFSPNKDMARSIIRNALDSILLKPPILTQKIVDKLVIDLSTKKDVLIDDDSLKRYLEAKFLKNLKPETETHLFRVLWKFVFKLSNDDTNKNRAINFKAIRILYSRNMSEIRGYIEAHKTYFSDVGEGELLDYLLDFLCETPSLYTLLTDSAKVLIQTLAARNLNNFARAYFLTSDFQTHLEMVMKKIAIVGQISDSDDAIIPKSTILTLLNHADSKHTQSLVVDIAIQSYIRSANYMGAALFSRRKIVEISRD